MIQDLLNRVKQNKLSSTIIGLLIILGVLLRFFVMHLGHNFDFESYCIVGSLSSHLKNIYEHTTRYNYGPIFFCIQGIFFKLSHANIDNPLGLYFYRLLIVSILTLADIGISLFIARKYSINMAILFFLNPISIIITGYHNQFDNIAILLALLTIPFFNKEDKFNKYDLFFVIFLSLSLITKHILFMLPIFIIFIKNLPIKKKLLYSCTPPIIFLLSFVPFAISSKAAFMGIINNVFLYASKNNSPLFNSIYNSINFPTNCKIFVFIAFMILIAYLTRKTNYDKILFIYLIALVTFSSAIANQYLVIPVAALCVLNTKYWKYIYIIFAGTYLILHSEGLHRLNYICYNSSPKICSALQFITNNGYFISCFILLITLLSLISWKTYINSTLQAIKHAKR